jgi:hypothetical protein
MKTKHLTTILVLFLATLPMMAQHETCFSCGSLKYYLHTPKGFDVWKVHSSPLKAAVLYKYSQKPNVVWDNDDTDTTYQYSDGEEIVLDSPPPGIHYSSDCTYVRSVQHKWEGWVHSSLIEPTKETKVILTKQAADEAKHEAERRAKNQEDQQRIRIERLKIQAACSVIYQNTINKKISDLTVREEQQVRACQALGFYN